ncbi:MAG: recombinase family protein [Polyangiaceae bacterium]
MSGSKKCAIYLRVSTGSQSVDNQRPEVEQLVRARGFEVAHVYEEQASAAKHRPEHERLMKDAKRGAFDVLIVWALDRFGRSMVGNLADVLELDRIGVTVVSVRESWLDTGGPVRSLLIAIFSWVAEQERERRGERTRAGLGRMRTHGSRSGRPIGRPRRLDGAGLARVRELQTAGRSIRSIAMAAGVPRPTIQRALAAYKAEPPD